MTNLLKSLFIILMFSSVDAAFAAGQGCTNENCVVTRNDYENVMSNFRELYSRVTFVARWSEDQPQAFASFGRVFVSGGFARKDDISIGGLLIVTCHEVGHALFSHNEGEADYFATKVCMKDYFKNFKEDLGRVAAGASERVQNVCGSSVPLGDRDVCIATLEASQNASQADANRCVKRLDDLFEDVSKAAPRSVQVEEFHFRCLRTLPEVVSSSFQTPKLLSAVKGSLEVLGSRVDYFSEDLRIVPALYSQHNSPICRMQTLRNGYFNQTEPTCWRR